MCIRDRRSPDKPGGSGSRATYSERMSGPQASVPATIQFTKGHGTQNDFVLIADQDAELDLTPALVRALTDRRAGIGGDGVIRVVPSAALEEGRALLAEDPDATWFMDYRNADGSLAEMCGNGVRAVSYTHLTLPTNREV